MQCVHKRWRWVITFPAGKRTQSLCRSFLFSPVPVNRAIGHEPTQKKGERHSRTTISMREDAPQLLCAHLFTKKRRREGNKNGGSILFPGYGEGSSADNQKLDTNFSSSFCQHTDEERDFFFLQYQISERRVFFQDWMARKTGSILDKEHVNYFFYSLYSLSKLLPA